MSKPNEAAELNGSSPVIAHDWERAVAFAFIVFWLGPISYVGLCDKTVPYFGVLPNYLCTIACLFTHDVKAWSEFHIQVKLPGEETWRVVSRGRSIRCLTSSAGHYRRIDRALSVSLNQVNGDAARAQIAEFVAQRFAENHPMLPKPEAVRFIYVRREVGDELATEGGRWTRRPLSDSQPDERQILSSHALE